MRYAQLVVGVICRPRLWWPLVVVGRRFIPNRWWTYPPFLPVPPREYVQFRMVTMYGDPHAVPSIDDLEQFVLWAYEAGLKFRSG